MRRGFWIVAGLIGLKLVAVSGLVLLSGGSHPLAAARRAWTQLQVAQAGPPHTGDVLMPVQFDAQDNTLSCEAAALKMALAYRGIKVSEKDIMDVIGYDPTPRTVAPDGTVTWGDPDKAFVGSISGRMFKDGYGVHAGPVARAAKKWRNVEEIRRWSAPQLAGQLAAGSPIIVWGYVKPGTTATWKTPEGKTVQAVNREHAFILNGFRGTVTEPEGFYVMDPVYGQRYFSTKTFMENWSKLGYAGIIVY